MISDRLLVWLGPVGAILLLGANHCQSDPTACAPSQFASIAAALGEPCTLPSDCTVANACLAPFCIDKECRSAPDPQKPQCCLPTLATACDDGNACTVDSCKLVLNADWSQCNHWPLISTAGCCDGMAIDAYASCNDLQPCTLDWCDDSQCKNVVVKQCCEKPGDCDDGNPCTQDACTLVNPSTVGKCSHLKACCLTAADCDDGQFCTSDGCDVVGGPCSHTPTSTPCCEKGASCDDGDLCTVTACVNHLCLSAVDTKIKGCCTTAAHCNDGSDCTADVCLPSGKCQSSPIGQCCTDIDAVKACDDGNPCTIEYCANFICRHTLPKNGCCTTTADCPTWMCTVAACKGVVNGQGQCSYAQNSTCSCEPGYQLPCASGSGKCAVDSCVEVNGTYKIVAKPLPDCCLNASDCDDGLVATVDFCLWNECVYGSK